MKTTIHTLKREYKDNQTYLNEKQNLFQNPDLSPSCFPPQLLFANFIHLSF